jgi:hypothetical protein
MREAICFVPQQRDVVALFSPPSLLIPTRFGLPPLEDYVRACREYVFARGVEE